MLIVIIYIDLLELILLVLTLFGEGERVEGSDDPDFSSSLYIPSSWS